VRLLLKLPPVMMNAPASPEPPSAEQIGETGFHSTTIYLNTYPNPNAIHISWETESITV
jgi:hypothetical protein